MLTEDYIMRLINQALAVFLQAVGLKKARKYDDALRGFDQALESLLGFDARLAKQLGDSQVLGLLTFQEKLDSDRLLVLADIYREEAEIYSLLGQPENSRLIALNSLRFYLEVTLANEAHPNLKLVETIEALRSKLAISVYPIETRLALMDYLDRLLASGNDFLTAAGLTRQNLQVSLASLDSADLHE